MSYSIGANNSITLTKGDSLQLKVGIRTADGNIYTPQPGDVIRFALKKDLSDELPAILKVIPTDTMELKLIPGDTKSMEPGSYVYDVELTKANGDVDTFITMAKFTLTGEVY